MLTFSATLEKRYWAKVSVRGDNECWPWTGSTHSFGHGSIYVGRNNNRGVIWYAHRVAWLFARGFDPGKMKVCHRCDNPPCQNPACLFLGTQADNIEDMMYKGRNRQTGNPGEVHPMAKLTSAQVGEIRRLYQSGTYLQRELAERFHIGKQQVSRIIRGERWAFLADVKGD